YMAGEAPLPWEDGEQRLEVLRIRLERPDPVAGNLRHDRAVDGRLDSPLPPFLTNVAVQMVDLGATALHPVFQNRWPPATQVLGARREVALDVLEALPGGRIEKPLRCDPVDRLHLVTRRAAHRDGLGGDVDADTPRRRLAPDLGGAEPAQASDRIRHAVHGEL